MICKAIKRKLVKTYLQLIADLGFLKPVRYQNNVCIS